MFFYGVPRHDNLMGYHMRYNCDLYHFVEALRKHWCKDNQCQILQYNRPPYYEAAVLNTTANSCNNCIIPSHTDLARG